MTGAIIFSSSIHCMKVKIICQITAVVTSVTNTEKLWFGQTAHRALVGTRNTTSDEVVVGFLSSVFPSQTIMLAVAWFLGPGKCRFAHGGEVTGRKANG